MKSGIKNLIKTLLSDKRDEKYQYNEAIDAARKLGVTIGNNCRIYDITFGSEPYLIKIGDNVTITNGVFLITHDGGAWTVRQTTDCSDIELFGEINIGNNVFIGINSIILPGVSIGDNVVVGAGSVVTKSFQGNQVIAGNPAKEICNIDDYKNKIIRNGFRTKTMSQNQKKEYILSLREKLFKK